VRLNPPPPPPKRSNSQHGGSDANLHHGLAPPYPIREPPHPNHELDPTPTTHRRNRSYDKSERRSHVGGRKTKVYHEADRQLEPDMTDSFHEERRRERSKSPGESLRYNRANSVPTVRTFDNYRNERGTYDAFSRSNSAKSYARENYRQNGLMDPIPWRPDPSSSEMLTDSGNTTNHSGAHVLSREYDDESSDRSGVNAFERCIESLMCIFPKVEPLPWSTFFLLSLWCALP
jgi:hypothetical protein